MTILYSSLAIGGGGSPSSFPTMPFPLNDDGFISNTSNRVAHKGVLVDNIAFPTTSTASWDGYLGESLIWSVSPANVAVAADNWVGENTCWYDNVNGRFYTFVLDTTTNPDTLYTSYITLETGAVTNIGNVALTTDPVTPTLFGVCGAHRTDIDSGNFTLFFNDRTIVIDEITGAEISNIASINATNTNQGSGVGVYVSLDGTISVHLLNVTQLFITRNKLSVRVNAPPNLFGDSTSGGLSFAPWGDKVKLFRNSGTINVPFVRTMDRIELDAWFVKVANFGGGA